MPLALFLQETVYTLCWGAYHLQPWMHLVQIEELLIDRARGAFLVHWFGSGLPLEGFFVRVVIANLAALRAQYLAAAQSLPAEIAGPNLLEPLAGMTGMIAGLAVSPTMMVLGMFAVALKIVPLVRKLGWKALGLFLLPVAQAVVLVVAIPGVVWLVAENADDARRVNVFLGSFAAFVIAGTMFLKLLSGPRTAIGNPLLRSILELFDRLAGLLPFVLAFVAILVSRLGPMIEPLTRQVPPFLALIDETMATLGDILGGIGNALDRLWPALLDKVDFVLVQLSLVFPALSIVLTELFTKLAEQLLAVGNKAKTAFDTWLDGAKQAIIDAAMSTSFVGQLASAKISLAKAGELLASPASSPTAKSSSPGKFPQLELPSADAYMQRMGGPPPGGLGAIDKLATIDIKYNGALFSDAIIYSKGAEAGAAVAVRPTKVFEAERGVLAHELGRTPERALADLRADQLGLRDLIRGIIGRVLPAALRTEIYTLDTLFDQLDRSLYEAKLEKPQDYPVLDLPDNGKLHAVVHRLVIRGVDLKRADADTFQARLQERLTSQSYPAEAPSGLLLRPA